MRSKTAQTATTRRRRPAPKPPQFQEPLIEHPEPVIAAGVTRKRQPAKTAAPRKVAARKPAPPSVEEEPGRPQQHNGVAVLREELRRNLPSNAPFKISKLHLEGGGLAFACRDCEFTADTNSEVQQHRNAEHGTRYGKRTPKVVWPKDNQLDDVILPPRGDQPAPTNPMEMMLGEFLAMVPSYAAMSDLIDRAERDRDAALARVAELQDQNRDAQHALAVYPTLQAEVVDLRLLTRNTGSYEELKAEVQALRAWKKKIIQRLEPLGFSLTEEEGKEQ
jgi:hypothetical protein